MTHGDCDDNYGNYSTDDGDDDENFELVDDHDGRSPSFPPDKVDLRPSEGWHSSTPPPPGCALCYCRRE